jgi:glutamine synthetase
MHVARKVASNFGYFATFMPKPFNDHNRSAFHMHLSMQDKHGKNLFYDETDSYGLSSSSKYFIGGILKHARETSIIMASTYNSYKAYTLEKEAPITLGWGVRNRSSMIRVPYSSTPSGTRIELRSPDPSGNVYLQMAVFIAMGLEGIKNKIEPGEPDVGNIYRKFNPLQIVNPDLLPRSMYEALAEAEQSSFLYHLLGERLFKSYLSLKIREWEKFRTSVTTMEHSAYLAI